MKAPWVAECTNPLLQLPRHHFSSTSIAAAAVVAAGPHAEHAAASLPCAPRPRSTPPIYERAAEKKHKRKMTSPSRSLFSPFARRLPRRYLCASAGHSLFSPLARRLPRRYLCASAGQHQNQRQNPHQVYDATSWVMRDSSTATCTTTTPLPLTVLYDGSCGMCQMEIRMYRASIEQQGLQDKIGFRDISAPDLATQSFLADNDLTPAAVFARFHTVKDDGTVLKNSAAFSELWQHMPGWRSLHYLLKMPGMPLIADMVYSGFLEVRKTDTFKKMNRALLSRYVQN